MANKFYTKEGLERLKEELEYLETARRKQVAARIKEALQQGDLSENAEYAEAKDEQAFVEGRIAELKETVKNAQIIEKSKGGATEVTLGTTVKIKNAEGEEKEYTIVGSGEADPMNGLISNESPIGKAFLGKKKGDKVEVQTPGGTHEYDIVELQ